MRSTESRIGEIRVLSIHKLFINNYRSYNLIEKNKQKQIKEVQLYKMYEKTISR